MAGNAKMMADKAMAALQGGQFNSAFKQARAASKAFPTEWFFPNLAGLAQAQMGDQAEAIGYFRKALRIAPNNMDVQNNLIQAYIGTGQYDRAEDFITKLMPKRPDRANLLYSLAMAQVNKGKPELAEATLNEAIEVDPKMARLYNLRGVARYTQGREAQALDDYQRTVALNPNAPDTFSNMALVLSRAGRLEEAMEAAETAIRIAPNYIMAYERRVSLLSEAGRLEEARAAIYELLERAPGHPEALLELAENYLPEAREQVLADIDKALAKTRKGTLGAAWLLLAKARTYLKAGDTAATDKWFQIANDAYFKLFPYDHAARVKERDRIFSLVPDAQSLPQGIEPELPRPIFVLGLPRSGTTLIEQMISSHPTVHGAGELPGAERGTRDLLSGDGVFDQAEAQAFAAAYRSGMPKMPEGKTAFVDKMPGNFRLIGFLLSAFPNAVIVHVRRDPREVALSMWHTVLSNPGQSYSFDQRSIAAQLNLYRTYMNHWTQLFGDRIHEVSYDDVVSDPEGASKTLAQVCGLEWIPDMAAPERNTNAVRTASVMQVRQPVHRKSIDKWKQHEGALAEVIKGLDPDLWPEIK